MQSLWNAYSLYFSNINIRFAMFIYFVKYQPKYSGMLWIMIIATAVGGYLCFYAIYIWLYYNTYFSSSEMVLWFREDSFTWFVSSEKYNECCMLWEKHNGYLIVNFKCCGLCNQFKRWCHNVLDKLLTTLTWAKFWFSWFSIAWGWVCCNFFKIFNWYSEQEPI